MKNRYVRMALFAVACIILIAAILSLLQDVNYFITKKETTGRVMSIEDLGTQRPYLVTVKYFNEATSKEVTSTIRLKKSYGNALKQSSNNAVRIYYSGTLPENLYLADYVSPRIGIIVFDGILVLLMIIAVYAYKDAFKKTT